MKTDEALTRFLQKWEELGKSQNTRRIYHGYLRHFADTCPELPTYTEVIEVYLKHRKETPGHRGYHFKCLQAFYSYLEVYEGIKSPIPKGVMGRPPKKGRSTNIAVEKVVRGGHRASTSISTSTAELVQKYTSFKKAEGVAKGTLAECATVFGCFVECFPTLPLNPDDISQFLGKLQMDPETKWNYRKRIVAFYHFLERRNIIPIITPSFPRVKVPRKVRRVLSEQEVMNLFNAAETLRDKAILTLLIDSKIRAGELASVVREHVFQDSIIVKGKTGERNIPISPLTYTMLTKLADSGPLFTVLGRPMTAKYLGKLVHAIMRQSGLTGKKLGPHILRHSASVFHIMHGGDLLSLQKELGHRTLRMTEKYGELAFPEVKQRHQETNVIGHILENAGPQTEVPDVFKKAFNIRGNNGAD